VAITPRVRNPVILLVEDNPDDEELTRRAFQQSNVGTELVVARDGAAALDYLLPASTDAKALPALVLLDLNLPKVSGLDVLRRMRAEPRTKLLPIVVLTSSKAEQDIVNSYGLGANSYVRKPVDFDEFAEAVRQLGVYWLALNEPPPAVSEVG
jgi:DNA-binding response OmpR family regulator